jgi:exodeoxyribonuclease VII large subunit
MQESFDFGSAGRKPPAEPRSLSVSKLNALVRQLLERRIPPLWVEGEISGWKRYSSGHRYFSIRDGDAQVDAVMFRSDAQRLPAEPEEGMKIRAFGSVTLFEQRGRFQFTVRRIEATGDGGLWRLAFERLRRKLEAEGLLDPARRRPLPMYPRTVGIVTSASGAVLHDIVHVIRRRAPWTRVLLSQARVQGEGAALDVARAIRLLQRAPVRPDVIIVGRGGGSVEDLWAFNEEPVARAIADCPVPVISAVGHETDVTIADLVADLRAPTPSAAAEHAVPDGATLRQEMLATRSRLGRALRRYAVSRRDRAEALRDRLEQRMHRLLENRRNRVGRLEDRMDTRMHRIVDARRAVIGTLGAQLDALSPLQSLRRGYAVPLDDDGHVLRRRAEFRPGAAFRLRVLDGVVDATTDATHQLSPDAS